MHSMNYLMHIVDLEFLERKGGGKTTDILEFYHEFIHSKYKNYFVIWIML